MSKTVQGPTGLRSLGITSAEFMEILGFRASLWSSSAG
jgi:hypothetical protein